MTDPGVLVRFQNDAARREWWSPRLNPWLRVVMLSAEQLCRKRGGTAPVSKIFGEGIYHYGDALDCHPMAISISGPAREERALADVVLSLNRLFPFGDGDIETALLVQGRLRLRVPPNGYRRESLALSSWAVDGVTPGPLAPRSRAKV